MQAVATKYRRRDLTVRSRHKEEALRVWARQRNRRERHAPIEEVEEALREEVDGDLEADVRFYWRMTRSYGSCAWRCECGLYSWYRDLLVRAISRLRDWRVSGVYSA